MVFIQMAAKYVMGIIRRFRGGVEQPHSGFFQCTPPFAMVAAGTGGDHIFPDMPAPEVSGEDMVNGEIGQVPAAVLAGKIIAAENFPAGHLELGARPISHLLQADDRRSGQDGIDRSNFPAAVEY